MYAYPVILGGLFPIGKYVGMWLPVLNQQEIMNTAVYSNKLAQVQVELNCLYSAAPKIRLPRFWDPRSRQVF